MAWKKGASVMNFERRKAKAGGGTYLAGFVLCDLMLCVLFTRLASDHGPHSQWLSSQAKLPTREKRLSSSHCIRKLYDQTQALVLNRKMSIGKHILAVGATYVAASQHYQDA